jgi:long-chain fatty acid transport protein
MLGAGWLLAETAAASPLFELLGDSSDQGGFAARTGFASAASSYFNPALLTEAAPGVSLGAFVLHDQIGVALDGRPGGDVPLAYRGATHADGSVFDNPSVPTRWLREGCQVPACPLALAARPRQSQGSSGDTHAYQAIGLVVPILRDRLVLGFYGLIPLSKFTTAHAFYSDEREQFFSNSLHPELYSDRLTATSLALGLGARVVRGLSFGLGATLSLNNSANAETFVGNADDLQHSLQLSTDVAVKVAIAPHFGISYQPIERLRLTATLHTVQQLSIDTGISTFLPNGDKQTAWRTTVHDYMPVRVGFGLTFDVITPDPSVHTQQHKLVVAAGGLLGWWSEYLDRHDEHPAGEYAWHNTVAWVLGVKHSYGPLRVFLDGTFAPTPVPAQTGRSNYVDNDRIGAALGLDYEFELLELRFRIGAHGQLHGLLTRSQTKLPPSGSQRVRDEFPDDAVDSRGRPIASAMGLQTNNPGWPGFSSSGLLFGAGVNLALLL